MISYNLISVLASFALLIAKALAFTLKPKTIAELACAKITSLSVISPAAALTIKSSTPLTSIFSNAALIASTEP